MSIISKLLGSVLRRCYLFSNNYGFAILLFTLLSKLILLPVSIWVQFNSIKMVKMQPELNRIKIDHFGDKDTIAEKTQKEYKKNHYHATASLIPLALQIILLLGVVSVIYHPFDYILDLNPEYVTVLENTLIESNENINPESSSLQLTIVKNVQNGGKELYQKAMDLNMMQDSGIIISEIEDLQMHFLGVDISLIPSVDRGFSILIPLLAGFSAWLLSFCQNKMNVLQAAQSKTGNMVTMLISVGISLYLGFFVPCGVAIYWIASNLITIIQQYVLNKVINPKKYVNWEELEETRKELESYSSTTEKRRWNDPLVKRSKQDYKKFFSLGNKHLVFYSESNGFYKYYAGTIKFILDHTNIPLHYITSDPNDSIFSMAESNPHIHPYYINSNHLITLMMKMDADVVVMTMPDLETFQIKRSIVREDVEYIYIPHCTNSLNLTMRKGCVDHFDAILATGKHQREEFEEMQKLHGIHNQVIVDAGYPLLDDLYHDYQNMLAKHTDKEKNRKTVLIAPSWQKGNIIDSCLDQILEQLKNLDFDIIVRPHPQHVRHMPERMEQLKQRYSEYKNIEIQTDFSSNEPIFMSDAIITDWSGIAYEYAFTTLKPVLFIDTPMKIMNPDYKELNVEPFNIWLREKIGGVVKPEEVEKVSEMIRDMLSNGDRYSEMIKKYRDEYDYNFLTSGEESARFIIHEVMAKIKEKEMKLHE